MMVIGTAPDAVKYSIALFLFPLAKKWGIPFFNEVGNQHGQRRYRIQRQTSVHKLDISMLDGDVSPQLPLRGSPHYSKCEKQSPELKERDETCDTSDFVTKTPSLKPLLNSLAVVPLRFFLCLFGSGLLDDGRRLNGGLTFVFRLLLGGLGILPWGFL
jgi:hypothetical protein